MNRKFWEHIQRTYPNAMSRCKYYFQQKFSHHPAPTPWRSAFLNHQVLFYYFSSQRIELETNVINGRYGLKVTAKHLRILIQPKWHDRQNAVNTALEYGFFIIEQRLRGDFYKAPDRPKSLSHKEERAQEERSTFGSEYDSKS